MAPGTHAQQGLPAWQAGCRESGIQQLSSQQWDLVVIGGGITGAGIYREAARFGWRVLLIEQQDFAWGTSSRSSKMVHGGLRYLGSGQFGLARDSVRERQKLMQELPGLVDPLPFLMGHYRGMFPGPWIFGKLLAVYDWMAGKHYRRRVERALPEFWAPGLRQKSLIAASGFADAVTDDARLVMRVLQAGNQDGGLAINYVRATTLMKDADTVTGVEVQDVLTNTHYAIQAKCVINATGAWTDQLRSQLGHEARIRPLRGSHLVLPFWRLPVGFSFSFFHPDDKRPVFVFPWEGATVVGTTDLDHTESMQAEACIALEEVRYLLDAVNHQFPGARIVPADIWSTWSGVRPVVSERDAGHDLSAAHKPSDEKREHAIWVDKGLISVAGGKLTTYRLIAEEVLEKAGFHRPATRAELSERAFAPAPECSQPALTYVQRRRLMGRYGEAASQALVNAGTESLARVGATDTLWWELEWACRFESVQHLDDLLLRRTRIGLLLPKGGQALAAALKNRCQALLDWSDARWQDEWQRYQAIVAQSYALPAGMEGGAA